MISFLLLRTKGASLSTVSAVAVVVVAVVAVAVASVIYRSFFTS